MNKRVDLLIAGGGIAGLWTLAAARSQGYSCLLLEKEALGTGQTIASQGIIHGGLKYSLGSVLTRATQTISDMPERWRQSLQGESAPDLQAVTQLSDAHYFVPGRQIDSKLISFLGAKMTQSYSEKVSTASLHPDYSAITDFPFLYRLNERVVDVKSLLLAFADQFRDCMGLHSFDINRLEPSAAGFTYPLGEGEGEGEDEIEARYVLLCAGKDNLTGRFNEVPMQRRPLHMVMVQGQLPRIYAHFIGHGSLPVMTVTSHPFKDETVWYIGGDIAEKGVNRSVEEQIETAKTLLAKTIPGIDLSQQQFSTLSIDRAEPLQESLLKPDDAYLSVQGNVLVGWPTKLAFAPRFADRVMETLRQAAPTPQPDFSTLTRPPVANYPWENH